MPTWLTVAEARRRFGLSRTTLYRLLSSGTVRRVKRTGDPKIYLSADDLEEATLLRPTGDGWLKDLLRLTQHRARAEEAFLRHLRDTRKRDKPWLKRHEQLRQRLKSSTDLVTDYFKDSEKEWGPRQ